MELRHLRYFWAVAEHGSLAKPGRQLGVSQSAISEQIADLEREIGGALVIVNTSATWSGVLTLVESGEGVALVPSGVRYLRPSGVVISPLIPENLHMGLTVAWNPENEGPILRDFLRLVRENKDRIQRTNGTWTSTLSSRAKRRFFVV